MTNHGFVVGNDPIHRIAKGLFENTTNTDLISDSGRTTISDLLTHLAVTSTITKPIENILLATHGSNEGWFELGLDFTTPVNTHYPDLKRAETDTSIFIKAPLIDTTLPSITVQFHGCRIGQAEEFVQQLKRTFGGNVLVSTPKVFDSVAVHTLTPARRRGARRRPSAQIVAFMESLVYDYTLFQKDKFLNKAAAVAGFKAKATAGDFALMDNTAPPDVWWTDWIPARIHKAKDTKQVTVAYGQTLQPINKTSFPTEVVYAYRGRTIPLATFIPPHAPGNEADRKSMLRQFIIDSDDDDFPIYKRLGYKTLDDLMDGVTVPRTTTVVKSGQTFHKFVGIRQEYSLKIPVTDPATIPTGQTNPIKANLIFNYYPVKSLALPAVETIVFQDGPLFRII